MAYPTTIDTWTTKADNVDDVLASHVNDLQTAVRYVEAGVMGGNYTIVPSVSSNNLTVELKTMAGTDASATDPIIIKIGDTLYSITAAASITANAGTNWMTLGNSETATKDVDLFLYAIYETGAAAGVKIGFARIPYATTMADFSSTSTALTYIKGNYTNKNATDKVAVIGRFNAILSGGAGYTWSLTTAAIINRPIYTTRWLTYVPTVGASSGVITTLGTITAYYRVNYNDFSFTVSVAITTNGTGAGALTTSIPFSAIISSMVCVGRETGVTGSMLQGVHTGTTISWQTYNNAYPGGSGYLIYGFGSSLRLI